MNSYGRRIVVDLRFEAAVGEVSRALREEGLQSIARIDVRQLFWRDLAHEFRNYLLLEAWSPELALEALRHNLDVGTLLPTIFAIYELTDTRTAVVANEALPSTAPELDSRLEEAPALATIADQERQRIDRVLARVRQSSHAPASILPAA